MLDPFTYWSRVLRGWQTIGDTAARIERTASDSRAVIASRSATMGDAMRSPWTADTAELSRMVPEKVAAFSAAGTVMMSAWWKMQADCAAEGQHLATMMLRPRPPTLMDLADLSERSTALGLRMFEAGSRVGRDALAPVHKSAAANAKRLRRAKV